MMSAPPYQLRPLGGSMSRSCRAFLTHVRDDLREDVLRAVDLEHRGVFKAQQEEPIHQGLAEEDVGIDENSLRHGPNLMTSRGAPRLKTGVPPVSLTNA